MKKYDYIIFNTYNGETRDLRDNMKDITKSPYNTKGLSSQAIRNKFSNSDNNIIVLNDTESVEKIQRA